MKIERLVLNPNGLVEAYGIDVPPEELEHLEKLLRELAEVQRATKYPPGG